MKNWIITFLATLLICNSDFWIEMPPILYFGVFFVTAIIVWGIDLQIDHLKWRKRECQRKLS